MPLTIIVRNKLKSVGRTDHERILKDAGWGGTMTDEQADKCDYLERRAKKLGIDRSTAFRGHQIDRVK